METLAKILPKRKRVWLLWITAIFFISTLISCGPTKLTITHARLTPKGQPASPPLIDAVTSIEDWETVLKPKYRSSLQDNVYGYLPNTSKTRVIDIKTLDKNAFDGLGTLEEYTLVGTMEFNGKSVKTAPFKMVVVIPNATKSPVPIILMESFCPNNNTVAHPLVSLPTKNGYSCDGGGIMNKTMLFVFGRYIATPPMEMILKRGYAFAAIYPSEYVPDRAIEGFAALKSLSAGHINDATRMGAIAAWAWGYSRMIDVLIKDSRFAKNALIPYGHSRYGKAALVAGAFDTRVGGVISHQSGTGGASLNKHKKGETIKDISDTYPHWFHDNYAQFAGHEDTMDFDQHALLALNAPKPIFLGNARRDVWSDPNGAFRAALGANPVYQLYGKRGLHQKRLDGFIPGADISFYMRPGTHGVVKEDWPAFLEFLDAHFK